VSKIPFSATINIDLKQEDECGDAKIKEKRLGEFGASVIKMASIDNAFWGTVEDLIQTHEKEHDGYGCAVIAVDIKMENTILKNALKEAQQFGWLRIAKSLARFCHDAIKIANMDETFWSKAEKIIEVYKKKHEDRDKSKGVITINNEDGRISVDFKSKTKLDTVSNKVRNLVRFAANVIEMAITNHDFLDKVEDTLKIFEYREHDKDGMARNGVAPLSKLDELVEAHEYKCKDKSEAKAVITISDEGGRISVDFEPKFDHGSAFTQVRDLAKLATDAARMADADYWGFQTIVEEWLEIYEIRKETEEIRKETEEIQKETDEIYKELDETRNNLVLDRGSFSPPPRKTSFSEYNDEIQRQYGFRFGGDGSGCDGIL